MIVKAGHIRNPLTVIGLFCILLEVALTAGMAAVPEVYFLIYLIFFMVLTVGVISTFFGILLLKPTALYGPSDYENPEDFFKALQMSSKNVVESVVELKQTLAMRDSELNAKISALEGVSDDQRSQLKQLMYRSDGELGKLIAGAEASANTVYLGTSATSNPWIAAIFNKAWTDNLTEGKTNTGFRELSLKKKPGPSEPESSKK